MRHGGLLRLLLAGFYTLGVSPASPSPAPSPAAFPPPIQLHPRLKLVGSGLETSCHCKPTGPGSLSVSAGACHLTSAAVSNSGLSSPSLEAAVHAHIGPPPSLRLALVASTPLACGEQGGADEVAGGWGGDTGELVLAAAAAERVGGRLLREAEVNRLVRAYISRSRAPYLVYHTTAAAHATLARLAGSAMALDMLAPPISVRPGILAALSSPEAHGCALLRNLVARGGVGGVRPELAVTVIRALHGILWDEGDPLRARIRYYVDVSSPEELSRSFKGASVQMVDVAASAAAPLRFGPLHGMLTLPKIALSGAGDSGSEPWRLVLDGRGGFESDAELAPAPSPSALLVVTVGAACAKLGRCALIAPHMPQRLSKVPAGAATAVLTPTAAAASAAAGGNATSSLRPSPSPPPPPPSFLVLHPQAVAARRNATAPLLASAFKLDASQLLNAMASIGADWDAAVDSSLGVGSQSLPKVSVLLT